jgi:hypothetical protein
MGLSREAALFFAAVVFTKVNGESGCTDEPLRAAAPDRWLKGLPVEAMGATAMASADWRVRNVECALGIVLSLDRSSKTEWFPILCYPEEQHWLLNLIFGAPKKGMDEKKPATLHG